MTVGCDAVRASRTRTTDIRTADHKKFPLQRFPLHVDLHGAVVCGRTAVAMLAIFHTFRVRVIVANFRIHCNFTLVAFID